MSRTPLVLLMKAQIALINYIVNVVMAFRQFYPKTPSKPFRFNIYNLRSAKAQRVQLPLDVQHNKKRETQIDQQQQSYQNFNNINISATLSSQALKHQKQELRHHKLYSCTLDVQVKTDFLEIRDDQIVNFERMQNLQNNHQRSPKCENSNGNLSPKSERNTTVGTVIRRKLVPNNIKSCEKVESKAQQAHLSFSLLAQINKRNKSAKNQSQSVNKKRSNYSIMLNVVGLKTQRNLKTQRESQSVHSSRKRKTLQQWESKLNFKKASPRFDSFLVGNEKYLKTSDILRKRFYKTELIKVNNSPIKGWDTIEPNEDFLQ